MLVGGVEINCTFAKRPLVSGNENLQPAIALVNAFLVAWLALTHVLAFLLFAWDKFKSGGSGGNRISEFNLAAIGAVGGWLGGQACRSLMEYQLVRVKTQGCCFGNQHVLQFWFYFWVPRQNP